MSSSIMKKSLIGLATLLGFTIFGNANAHGFSWWPFSHSCCSHERCDRCGKRFDWGGKSRRHSRKCGCQKQRCGCFSDWNNAAGFYSGHRVLAVNPQYGHRPTVRVPYHPHPVARKRVPVLPPPGTLGWTYRQPSRPIPEAEHPRTGMLEIHGLTSHCKVTVNQIEGFRGTDCIWYFKTKRPLVPGVPHIVTVRARVVRNGVLCDDVRVVRLIRGRIVDLSYRNLRPIPPPFALPRKSAPLK